MYNNFFTRILESLLKVKQKSFSVIKCIVAPKLIKYKFEIQKLDVIIYPRTKINSNLMIILGKIKNKKKKNYYGARSTPVKALLSIIRLYYFKFNSL